MPGDILVTSPSEFTSILITARWIESLRLIFQREMCGLVSGAMVMFPSVCRGENYVKKNHAVSLKVGVEELGPYIS